MSTLDVVGCRPVFVVDRPDEAARARDSFRRQLVNTYLVVDYHQKLFASFGFEEEVAAATSRISAGDTEGAARAVSDRMVDTFAIIDTADGCLERVSEYSSLVGWFLMLTITDGLSRSETLSAARRVIHAFGGKRQV